ncbi:MAG TPA: sulfite exporter TauE/SafE family protein [Limnochordales bacterium]
MGQLLVMALVGLVAQLVDGSTGMAYGVTSASLLMMAGLAPAMASASVHTAELVTTALSGLAHRRRGNVHWPLVAAIALPGAVGAFVGAAFLTRLPGHMARPYVASFLFGLGAWILIRYLRNGHRPVAAKHADARARSAPVTEATRPRPWLAALGALAGFADAIGGGGWGPLTTPVLMAGPGVDPRKVVGSVDTAEFLVAAAATAGFLTAGTSQVVEPLWVVALMVGGAVAAPLAAHIVSRVPPRILGVGVGGMVMLTNAPAVAELLGVEPSLRTALYATVTLAWLAAVAVVWAQSHRRLPRPRSRWYGRVEEVGPHRSTG